MTGISNTFFPKFESQVLKEYPTRLQEIHERYKKIEGSLKIANHVETKDLIRSWITDDPKCREIKDLVNRSNIILTITNPAGI